MAVEHFNALFKFSELGWVGSYILWVLIKIQSFVGMDMDVSQFILVAWYNIEPIAISVVFECYCWVLDECIEEFDQIWTEDEVLDSLLFGKWNFCALSVCDQVLVSSLLFYCCRVVSCFCPADLSFPFCFCMVELFAGSSFI